MAIRRHPYIHTHVSRVKQCSHLSVGLAQARPKYCIYSISGNVATLAGPVLARFHSQRLFLKPW